MSKVQNFMRSQYHQVSPHFPRILKPEDAKTVKIVDGKIDNDDLVFSPWCYIDDRFAAGGGYSMRHSWVSIKEEQEYRLGQYDEEGYHYWIKIHGLVELIQFKSSSVKEVCTIIGDLSKASVSECT